MLEAQVQPEDIDGGASPTEVTSQDSPVTRPGPVPLDDDSWDADHAWPNRDTPSLSDSDRYLGRRRLSSAGSDYRWWIGGAAAVIASTAAVALIIASTSGSGGAGSSNSPAAPNAQSTSGQAATSESLPPVGGGSVPVGEPTIATGDKPFAVTIEAESGSPTVILSGSAVVVSDERASGGQIVTKLGNSENGPEPGAMQMVGISVPSAGTYRVAIHFANLEGHPGSSADVTLTGSEPRTVNFSGNRRCCGVRTIDVTLAAGPQMLTITNATGPAPSIDKIVLTRS